MWKPEKILFDESDDEGLSYVYFDLGDFVISPSRSILMKMMKYILSLTNRLFRLKAIMSAIR